MTKMCVQCATTKDLSEFYRHPNTKDGHGVRCKDCARDSVKKNQNKNSNYYKAYYKERKKQRSIDKMSHSTIREIRVEYGMLVRQILEFRRTNPALKVNDCIQIMSNDNTDLVREAWRISLEWMPQQNYSPP